MAGKGSKPRPIVVPKSQFDDNWDKIFSKKDVGKSKRSTDSDSKKQKGSE